MGRGGRWNHQHSRELHETHFQHDAIAIIGKNIHLLQALQVPIPNPQRHPKDYEIKTIETKLFVSCASIEYSVFSMWNGNLVWIDYLLIRCASNICREIPISWNSTLFEIVDAIFKVSLYHCIQIHCLPQLIQMPRVVNYTYVYVKKILNLFVLCKD